ncbi:hypothetical protein FOMG_17660 [Fusarium oxysporum f. sp. melonis 26406]|uniref:Uncharacterized protein n=1 Tax=Fusarium oxysporum f. sp. melonis 26406 TaxID=1089452 RepID=W9ZBQ7_FUSOX|nr:hypothetical protein FOMG_17660 [Fusarium oxysporum f. sp. melonis 26406]
MEKQTEWAADLGAAAIENRQEWFTYLVSDYPCKLTDLYGNEHTITKLSFVAGNTYLLISERLKALNAAFVKQNHDAHIWLDGLYLEVLAMERGVVEAYGSLAHQWAGADTGQLLELIHVNDPFQLKSRWNVTMDLYLERATSKGIADAAHGLLLEQGNAVVDATLP